MKEKIREILENNGINKSIDVIKDDSLEDLVEYWRGVPNLTFLDYMKQNKEKFIKALNKL